MLCAIFFCWLVNRHQSDMFVEFRWDVGVGSAKARPTQQTRRYESRAWLHVLASQGASS